MGADDAEAEATRKLEFDFDAIAVLGFKIDLGRGKAAELARTREWCDAHGAPCGRHVIIQFTCTCM